MDNEMTKKSALMMWVGFLLILLGGLLLVISWIQIQYQMGSAGGLIAGTAITVVGAVLVLIGAFRG